MALYEMPFPNHGPRLHPDTEAHLVSAVARSVVCTGNFPDYLEAARAGQISPTAAALFVKTLAEHNPQAAISIAIREAHCSDDASGVIALAIAGLDLPASASSGIADPSCRRTVALTASNHGRLRIRSENLDLATFLSDPVPALERLAG